MQSVLQYTAAVELFEPPLAEYTAVGTAASCCACNVGAAVDAAMRTAAARKMPNASLRGQHMRRPASRAVCIGRMPPARYCRACYCRACDATAGHATCGSLPAADMSASGEERQAQSWKKKSNTVLL